jgi:hypothetical protein
VTVVVWEDEDDVSLSCFGAALAGAAKPATARMPVIKSVAANFFIPLFLSYSEVHTVTATVYGSFLKFLQGFYKDYLLGKIQTLY